MKKTRTLGTIKQNHSVIIEQGLQDLAKTLDKSIQKMNALVSYESVINEIYEGGRQPKRVTEIYCNTAEFHYEIEIITGKLIQVTGNVKFDSDGLYCDIDQILKEDGFGDYLVLPDYLLETVRTMIHNRVEGKVGDELEDDFLEAQSESQDCWFERGCDSYHAYRENGI
jgi:hypothetical protein